MSADTGTYLDLPDGRIYYEVAGEGPALLLLHAAFTGSRMWDDQWAAFGERHTAIRYDMRGYGRSTAPETPVSRREELYRLLEHLGVSRVTLIGCSLGGAVALDAALERPELVAGLVIVSAVPGGFEMQGEPPPLLLEMFGAVEQRDLDRASELQMRVWIDGPSRQPGQADAGVRRRAAEMSRRALETGGFALAVLAPPPDPLDPPAAQRLDQIDAPTLIVAGALDDPELLRAAGAMASAIPGAQKVIIPNAAHLPNMEQPEAFNEAVLAFTREVA